MNRIAEWLSDVLQMDMGNVLPWYRRRDVWMVLTAVLVPFGWVWPVGRVALARVRVRRGRRF
jgi:hypothetical protein